MQSSENSQPTALESAPLAAATGLATRKVAEKSADSGDGDFRVDLERIRFSPYFSRLSAATRFIPQAGSGTVIHNRLTHFTKPESTDRDMTAR